VVWLLAALLVSACGSRRSTPTTTVSSVTADNADQTGAEGPSQAHAEVPIAGEQSTGPADFGASVTVDDEAFDSTEEPPRRDAKLLSYEEAMARPMEIGDVSAEGGEGQLSAAEVAWILDDHLDEMYDACIEKELRRGNELETVTVDLAIRGKDGMVLGVTIEPGRRRFKSCLESYLEDLWFPTFASARMGVRYRFHAG
jgi:hypothetical protein